MAAAGRTDGRVELRLTRDAGAYLLDVTDDGPGIPKEARGRLFRPYSTFREGGLGLGLAIARKILLDHGGQITLLPADGLGASFRLTLPLPPS
jgi:two-component system NtrC family sensor kinase